jgi:hypothetical protein
MTTQIYQVAPAVAVISGPFCLQDWSGRGYVADNPDEEPYITSTAPASMRVPRDSADISIARFSLPSPLKSPVESEKPNPSSSSAVSSTFTSSIVSLYVR